MSALCKDPWNWAASAKITHCPHFTANLWNQQVLPACSCWRVHQALYSFEQFVLSNRTWNISMAVHHDPSDWIAFPCLFHLIFHLGPCERPRHLGQERKHSCYQTFWTSGYWIDGDTCWNDSFGIFCGLLENLRHRRLATSRLHTTHFPTLHHCHWGYHAKHWLHCQLHHGQYQSMRKTHDPCKTFRIMGIVLHHLLREPRQNFCSLHWALVQ